ncbi:MAG: hypothetical protein WCJ33_07990 [Pseudomonadota bacterium]
MAEENSIFQEIDDSLRVENFERFLRRHGKKILLAIFLLIISVAANVVWKDYNRSKNMEITDIILKAQKISDEAKYDDATQALAAASEGSRGISFIAKFKQAENLIKSGKFDQAIAVYHAINENKSADSALRDLALINLVIISENHNLSYKANIYDEIKDIYNKEGTFSNIAGELYALNLLKIGNKKEAYQIFDNIAKKPAIPNSQRERVASIAQIIKEDSVKVEKK